MIPRHAYYNENDPYCAQWLKNLIAKGLIPDGEVDSRSIRDVSADDVREFQQCHWFAGIGGFGLSCRLAGYPDESPIWTGGFPCQPFSVAGKQLAQEDDRHLWPVLFGLIEQARPAVFVGENVAGIIDLALDGVLFDLESAGYASRAFVVPACAVDAPHRRDRVWIAARSMADAAGTGSLPTAHPGVHGGKASAGAWHGEPQRRGRGSGGAGSVAYANCATGQQDAGSASRDEEENGGAGRIECQPDSNHRSSGHGQGDVEYTESIGRRERRSEHELRSRRTAAAGAGGPGARAVGNACGAGLAGSEQRGQPGSQELRIGAGAAASKSSHTWSNAETLIGADGKARRVEPGIRLLAHGIPSRVAKLRAGGNAIVPQIAAEIIRALMETQP